MRAPERASSAHIRGNGSPRLVGNSQPMAQLREQIDVAARYDEPVLILGETGVGKELVARAIHAGSARASERLQVINCAGVRGELLSAELFGHRAGAFTGAARDRPGRLLSAEGSTVLLDELSETTPDFQAAVLRALESGEIQPLGHDEVRQIDVRFLATSNRDPTELAEGAAFRQDLLHRIAGFVIEVPPLRERLEDLPLLVRLFLAQLAVRYGVRRRMSRGARDLLRRYDYPGNVRELRRIVIRAFAHAAGSTIAPMDVGKAITHLSSAATSGRNRVAAGGTQSLALQDVIRAHISHTIALADRNLSEAARLLEIPRSTLQHYLAKYRIEPAEDDERQTRAQG